MKAKTKKVVEPAPTKKRYRYEMNFKNSGDKIKFLKNLEKIKIWCNIK
jgi:hypothetical protein